MFRQAAKDAKVSVDTNHIALAFTQNAFVANMQIKGIEKASDRDFREGVESLFIYLSLPRGVTENTTKNPLPTGFYIVRLTFGAKGRRGTATLLNSARREIITLPATVETDHAGTSVSAYANWCHVGVDLRIRAIVLTIDFGWC